MKKKYLWLGAIVVIGLIFATMPHEKASTDQPSNSKTSQEKESHLLDVPYMNQKEKYPSGCESISTIMALNYLGVNITPEEFIDDYLEKGTVPYEKNHKLYASNPWNKYVGSPYDSNGYGCYAPVIVKALRSFLNQEEYDIYEHYDLDIEDFCKQYIQNDIPVILWASIDMQPLKETYTWYDEETKKSITWKSPMHCLLLIGYDQNYFYFNDPMREKNIAYKKADVQKAYEGLYSQAVAIVKK